jgi:hypothetical protein
MAELLEELIIEVGTSGQDDVIKAFGAIGKAAEESGKKIAESFGGGFAKEIAGAGIALTGAAAGFGVWVKSAEEATESVNQFAQQLGEAVTEVSAFQSAVVSMGGSLTGIDGAFRRLATVAQRTWDEIRRQSVVARDQQKADAISVGEAEENLYKARKKHRDDLEKAGVPGGAVVRESVQSERMHAARQADLELQKAELALSQAQKKADTDRLNDINNIAAAVQSVVHGQKSVAEAGKSANLETGKIVEGLVAGATPGALDALKGFTGNINDLASMSPKVLDLFKETADFMKHSGDATRNAALATQLFGRALGTELLPVLRQGREEIERNIQEAQRFGLAIDPKEALHAEEYHRAYNSLTGDLQTMVQEVGRAFGPSFTEGMGKFDNFLKQNNQSLKAWAAQLADTAKPAIEGFFDALTGLAASIAGIDLKPKTNAQEWKQAFDPIVQTIKTTREEIDKLTGGLNKLNEFLTKTPFEAHNAIRQFFGFKPLDKPYMAPEQKPAAPQQQGTEGTGTGFGTGVTTEIGQHLAKATAELERTGAAEKTRILPGDEPWEREQKLAEAAKDQEKLRKAAAEDVKERQELAKRQAEELASNTIATRENTAATLKAAEKQSAPSAGGPPAGQFGAGAFRPAAQPGPEGAWPIPPGFVVAPGPGQPGGPPAGAPPPPTRTPAEQAALDRQIQEQARLSDRGRIRGPFFQQEGGISREDVFPRKGTRYITEEGYPTDPRKPIRPILGPFGDIIPGAEQAARAQGRSPEFKGGALQKSLDDAAGVIKDGAAELQAKFKDAFSDLPQMVQPLKSTVGDVDSALAALAEALKSAASKRGGGGGGGGGGSGIESGGWGTEWSGSDSGGSSTNDQQYAGGGIVRGPGGIDNVLMWGTAGEGVITTSAMRHYGGRAFINAINSRRLPRYFFGGMIEGLETPLRGYATGGVVRSHGGALGRPLVLNIGGERISGMTASEAAASAISRVATARAVRSGGTKASWYTGN